MGMSSLVWCPMQTPRRLRSGLGIRIWPAHPGFRVPHVLNRMFFSVTPVRILFPSSSARLFSPFCDLCFFSGLCPRGPGRQAYWNIGHFSSVLHRSIGRNDESCSLFFSSSFFPHYISRNKHMLPLLFFPTQDLGSRLRRFSPQAILLRARYFSPQE